MQNRRRFTISIVKAAPFLPLVKIKLCKTLCSVKITESYHLVLLEHVLLRSPVLAADAAVYAGILIIKHIDVEVSHKAGWTPII